MSTSQTQGKSQKQLRISFNAEEESDLLKDIKLLQEHQGYNVSTSQAVKFAIKAAARILRRQFSDLED